MQTMTAPINEERLNQLLGKAIVDFGAAFHAPLVIVGDRLGLYKALAEVGPLAPDELAERTGTAERYVREWLNAQAAGALQPVGRAGHDAGLRRQSGLHGRRLTDGCTDGCRRAGQTPFNLVFEARP